MPLLGLNYGMRNDAMGQICFIALSWIAWLEYSMVFGNDLD